jgi:hypothetical protein
MVMDSIKLTNIYTKDYKLVSVFCANGIQYVTYSCLIPNNTPIYIVRLRRNNQQDATL